jgi:hypothetical protein
VPFTPLHMGPGIILKSLFQGDCSLMVYGRPQIVIKLQPLLVMRTQKRTLLGFTHPYLAGTLLAVVVTVTLGIYSHLPLDSLIHFDMEPFWPIVP